MSTRFRLIVLGLMLLSVLVSSAALGGAEPTLQEALDLAGLGINVGTDELFETEFLIVGDYAHMEVLAQYAGLANVTGVAWQAHKPIAMGETVLTPRTGGVVGRTADFVVPGHGAFEMLLTVEDYHWWHSIPEMNADGMSHVRVFPMILADGVRVDNAFVFAWEDRWNLGDGDYQDMIFSIEDVSVVPEPGTLAPFGALAGLAGLTRLRRRR